MCRLVIFSMLFLLWSPQNLEAREQVTKGARVRVWITGISCRSQGQSIHA